MNQKLQGWIGLALVVWPVIKMIAHGFGVPLPDLNINGLDEILRGPSTLIGAAMLASTDPIVGKKAKKL